MRQGGAYLPRYGAGLLFAMSAYLAGCFAQ